MLLYGKGVDRNEEEAAKLYKKEISNNDEVSMLEYGRILLDRIETEESLSEGIELIRKSAELGYGEGLYEYCRILKKRKFVEKASKRCNRKAKESLLRLINHTEYGFFIIIVSLFFLLLFI